MKKHFPFFQRHPDLIYLDTAATSQKPRPVIEALRRFYSDECATVHRSIYRASILATEQYNETRRTAQRFLNASSSDEIVFTRGTTDALNLVAFSYGRSVLLPGDEVLVTEMEHHSNLVPWQLLCQQVGARLRTIPVTDTGTLDWSPDLITSRTKIVAVGHASNVTGTINPIREIAAAAHTKGAVIVVDGAQAAPHLPIDVQALDVDFYAFSSHKCYGPTGIGILYGKYTLLEAMPPYQGGGDMIQTVYLDESIYQKPPLRFEAGTPSIAAAIALKPALEFLMDCDLDHEQELLQLATHHLNSIPGCRIIGTAEDKIPIVTFHIDDVHPLDLATLLDLKQVAIRSGHLCAQPLLRHFGLTHASRISFGIYTTADEVERAMIYLKETVTTLHKTHVYSNN
jgi:cysteine desulfurase/selenocysteine lyase